MSKKSWLSYPPPESKNQSPWRWVILALGCLMMIGPYYCFDIPAAVKTQLKNRMGNPTDYEVQFNLLYTLYATPNVRNNLSSFSECFKILSFQIS